MFRRISASLLSFVLFAFLAQLNALTTLTISNCAFSYLNSKTEIIESLFQDNLYNLMKIIFHDISYFVQIKQGCMYLLYVKEKEIVSGHPELLFLLLISYFKQGFTVVLNGQFQAAATQADESAN